MKKLIALVYTLLALCAPGPAEAGTHCVSYMSGSYRKSSCTHSYGHRLWVTRGVSYKSGSYRRSGWN